MNNLLLMSSNLNAPVISNTWGVLINVLDACLVNGLDLPVISSFSVQNKICTLQFSSNHQLSKNQTIEISNSYVAWLSGRHVVRDVITASSITIQSNSNSNVVKTNLNADAKIPALGFSKKYSGLGKAAYQPNSKIGRVDLPFLRVVDRQPDGYMDGWAKFAMAAIVEDMKDIDDLSSLQAPFDSIQPDRNWVISHEQQQYGWAKWFYKHKHNDINEIQQGGDSSSNKEWLVIGDQEKFYLLIQGDDFNNRYQLYTFGNIIPMSAFSGCDYILGSTLSNAGGSENNSLCIANGNTLVFQRNLAQQPLCGYGFALGFSDVRDSFGARSIGTVDANTLRISEVFAIENNEVRGVIQDYFWGLHEASNAKWQWFSTQINNQENWYIAVPLRSGASAYSQPYIRVCSYDSNTD